jgi:NADPH:quinone reductase-like Zn-dependent oxidoreductase
MYGIQVGRHGGPEVLKYGEIDQPEPGEGEVLVRVHAAGLNYIDTYHRTGYYPVPALPTGLGVEGAGVVEGTDRRVAFAVASPGRTSSIVPSRRASSWISLTGSNLRRRRQ